MTYSIKQAAGVSGLPESTLRYYETIGIIPPIQRDASSSHRVYTEDDINLIVAIACLSATGLSLDDMRVYLANRTRGESGAKEQIVLLENQRLKLAAEAEQLASRREYVDLKITYWQAVLNNDDAQQKVIAEQSAVVAKRLKHTEEKV